MFNRTKNNKAESKCSKDEKMANYNGSDLFRKYVHDIRNMIILDKETINNIRNMTNEEKMDIILALNDVVENLKSVVENSF
jgi:galactose-1-phosphate uridylyltransferase